MKQKTTPDKIAAKKLKDIIGDNCTDIVWGPYLDWGPVIKYREPDKRYNKPAIQYYDLLVFKGTIKMPLSNRHIMIAGENYILDEHSIGIIQDVQSDGVIIKLDFTATVNNFQVGDIIKWDYIETYGKILDIKDDKLKICFLMDCKESPNKQTDWSQGEVHKGFWIYDEDGYAPLKSDSDNNNDRLHISLFERTVAINAPKPLGFEKSNMINNLTVKNCSISGIGIDIDKAKVGDIIQSRWKPDNYAKILDMKNKRVLLSWLELDDPPNQDTDFSNGRIIREKPYDLEGYIDVEGLSVELFITSSSKLCKCTNQQLMIKGCTCGGI